MPPVNWTLSPGDVLAHDRVISPLGSGGMGQVFLAEDIRLGRRLALKVLAPPSVTADDRIERFDREARSISALNHPNIITMHDTGHVAAYASSPPSQPRCCRSPLAEAGRVR